MYAYIKIQGWEAERKIMKNDEINIREYYKTNE